MSMSAESRAGLGVLLLAALAVVLVVDTFPQKYRTHMLIAMGALMMCMWGWLCL